MRTLTAFTLALLVTSAAVGATLEVGPGKEHADIVSALAKAQPGDTILVHPLDGNRAYARQGLMVRKARLAIQAAPGKDGRRVRIDGAGFDYSGRGSVPRAIFQFDPQAEGCTLEGFELTGAHNDSHNGAGVRINQACHVTVRNCEITGNDMGIMSNGNGTPQAAVNQRIERCLIHHNGNFKEPGQNHNLYLGGTSVTLSACEVYGSLTGHNVKSRAHHTRVEYCYIHDSANREFDLVDAKGDTTAEGSDAVLLGNVIVKDRNCRGNRATIHFGQDGGNEHDGTIWLVNNTIVSPFLSPIVDLSAPKARAKLVNNIVCDGGTYQAGQKLVAAKGALSDRFSGAHNWVSRGFENSDFGAAKDFIIAKKGETPEFRDPVKGDYHLGEHSAGVREAGQPFSEIALPGVPGAPPAPAASAPSTASQPVTSGPPFQYKHPADKEPRPQFAKPSLGAYEYVKKP